jgi:hypothetical protein
MKKYLIMVIILGFIGNAIASQAVQVVAKNNNKTQSTLLTLGE